MVESQTKTDGRSEQSNFQNHPDSDHDPSSNDDITLYKNSKMNLDLKLDGRMLFRDVPGISGGCIISERPIFLNNSILCVINNRKCSLYNSKDEMKLCDTYYSPEMIIGCRSFVYDNKYEILICGSSDGTVLGYNVTERLLKDIKLSNVPNSKLDVVFELRIECKNLLAIEANRENGDIICVILNKHLKTEVIRFSLDYPKILFSECNSSTKGSDFTFNNNSMDIDMYGSSNNNNLNGLSNRIYINTNHTNDSSNSITNNHNHTNGKVNGNNNHTNHSNGTINGNHTDVKLFNGFKSIVSVDLNLEIFEVDEKFSKIAIGAGKSCLVVDLKTDQCFYFENDQVITCIVFDNRGTLTIGDSTGQITILSLFTSVNLVNKSQISMITSNTSSSPVLSFRLKNNNVDFTSLSHNLNDPTHSNSNTNHTSDTTNTLISVNSITNGNNHNSKDNKEKNNRKETEMVWSRVEAKRLHWHSHGVNCMCYSKNQLLSAGEEGVVVVWDLDTQSKKFVTRLGAPVFHIGVGYGLGIGLDKGVRTGTGMGVAVGKEVEVTNDKGVGNDKVIFASLQNNTIMLIDSISLSVYAKISCLSMDTGIGNECLEETRIIKYYPECNEVKAINFNRRNNNSNSSSTNKTSTTTNNTKDNDNLRNKIIVANNNKLQVYDYVRHCESRVIDVSNINYVSRQDEEFGQNYQITNMCVSDDSRYILVVQSRSVTTNSTEDEMELSEDRKYILKFYHRNSSSTNKTSTTTNNNSNHNSKDKTNGNKDNDSSKNLKDTDDYVLHTTISNPHRKKVTGLKQLYNKNKYISTSVDGKMNIYSLVKVSVGISSNNSTGTSVVSSNSTTSIVSNEHVKETLGREMWICSLSIDYKEMPIYSLTMNENNMMVLKHDMVLSVWRYSEDSDKELMLMKAMMNPLAKELLFIKFVDNETLLLCTINEVYMYNMKYGSRNLIFSLKGDEELYSVVCKYGLLVINVRNYSYNNYVNVVEIFDVKKKFMKIYSKVKRGINSQLSLQLVSTPIELGFLKNMEEFREKRVLKIERTEKIKRKKMEMEVGEEDNKTEQKIETKRSEENNNTTDNENEDKKDQEGKRSKQDIDDKIKENIEKIKDNYNREEESKGNNESKQNMENKLSKESQEDKKSKEIKEIKQKISNSVFNRDDRHFNLLIINHQSNEIEVLIISKIGGEYVVKEFRENRMEFKKIEKEKEKGKEEKEEMDFVFEYIKNLLEKNRNKNKDKNKEKKKKVKKFSMVSRYLKESRIEPKINSITEIIDESYPSTNLPSPSVILDKLIKRVMS